MTRRRRALLLCAIRNRPQARPSDPALSSSLVCASPYPFFLISLRTLQSSSVPNLFPMRNIDLQSPSYIFFFLDFQPYYLPSYLPTPGVITIFFTFCSFQSKGKKI